jgi:hypothetical protein
MRQNVLLPLTFLPHQSVQLGRLVLNVQEPQADFIDPLPNAPQDVIIKPQNQFHGQESSATAGDLGSTLCHLLSVSRSKQKRVLTRITTERVTTYLLNNSGHWFQQAVQDEQTRKWIETANRRGEDIYLVVGYHTVLNAQVYESGTQHHTTAGNIALPVAEALTATGIIVPFGEVIDPSIKAGHQRSQAGQLSFTAVGEQICSVQYRKVQFKWYTSRELHDKPLGPNKWKTYWTFRGQTDDMVEVDLQDDLKLGDEDGVCIYDKEEMLWFDTNLSSVEAINADGLNPHED